MSRILLVLLIVLFILVFFILRNFNTPVIIWFIALGFSIGLYYGWFNNDIFHQSAKFNNEFEKVHALWIHIVSGLAGSVSLFVLFNKYPFFTSEFGLGDFGLLILGILGIVGLLPRTFWFLANSGDLFKKLFK